MDEQEDLDQFLFGDDEAAKRAFGRLWTRKGPAVVRYVFRRFGNGLSNEDAEDIAQRVGIKMLERRKQAPYRNPAGWHTYVIKSAHNQALDELRKPRPPQDLLLPPPPPPPPATPEEIRELGRLANAVLLGLSLTCDSKLHNVQAVAARMHYHQGVPVAKIIRILSPSMPAGERLDARTLDSWLSDPAVLRYLAYLSLYYSGNELAGHILCSNRSVDPKQLDSYMKLWNSDDCGKEAHRPGAFEWREVAVILWRFRYGLPVLAIKGRDDCPYTGEEEVRAACDRFEDLFPFKTMREVLVRLQHRIVIGDGRPSMTLEVMHQQPLWQRLAFQYCYHDGLSHKDILSRMPPPADGELDPDEKPYVVNENSLNSWLSQGRLRDRVLRAASPGGEEQGHE